MAISSTPVVRKQYVTNPYDGTNGQEIADFFGGTVLSDDGQVLQFSAPPDYTISMDLGDHMLYEDTPWNVAGNGRHIIQRLFPDYLAAGYQVIEE